ncbi:2-polyprenylphenol 6-hydroxylase [Fodinicurvata fenggangensis]|uniref:2-polyprenylphenol 6-hydroxylase n=1 Tax=Fodinicurvata fenggangensis TaxID=1121830 RepID=UPI00047BFF49|nr:2-polyprenylphenol 6-hydroxylase [Fodinicurvata fenggangensis]
MRTLLSFPFRLLHILRVLTRHDALAVADAMGLYPALIKPLRRFSHRKAEGRPGQKLARALGELGPSFIKLGQFLATRADLVGEDVAGDLAELQDRLPPFSFEEARRLIESELGQPLEVLFEDFDSTPVSAASIAQVHFATTRPSDEEISAANSEDQGFDEDETAAPAVAAREVAVKILRPGIERAFERDLQLFYLGARMIERSQPALRRFRPVAVVELFENTVRLEMDFRMEAAAASELADNFADDPDYEVPDIDWERTAQRVLTQTRLTGIRLDDRQALVEAGHDLTEVLSKASAIFFNQVFRDGFFHGDQHPGNMFVTERGTIAAVDFGIMGRLDRRTRYFLADMLLATLDRDYRRLAEVQMEAGYLPSDQAVDTYAQALRAVCEPIFGRPLNRISFARLLGQLFKLTETFNLSVQPQLVLLQKNMLMAEGVSRRLDPALNIWLLAEPLIVRWMQENRGLKARLKHSGEALAGSLERLPDTLVSMERTLHDLSDNGLRLHSDTAERFAGRRRIGWALPIGSLALLLALAAILLD